MSSPNTISREQLVAMFHDMEFKYRWKVDADLVWGYFFTAEERGPLERLRGDLEGRHYRFVEYLDGDEGASPTIHLERIETHTADSLHERNEMLARLAQDLGVVYDGMDVGPLPTHG